MLGITTIFDIDRKLELTVFFDPFKVTNFGRKINSQFCLNFGHFGIIVS